MALLNVVATLPLRACIHPRQPSPHRYSLLAERGISRAITPDPDDAHGKGCQTEYSLDALGDLRGSHSSLDSLAIGLFVLFKDGLSKRQVGRGSE